jgi:hypothetical protein
LCRNFLFSRPLHFQPDFPKQRFAAFNSIYTAVAISPDSVGAASYLW